MITLLIVIQLILAIVITIAVLLQKSSSIGLGAYSGSNESLFGAKGPAGFLTKFTFVVAIIFVLNTILLGYQYSKNLDKSLVDSVKTSDLPYESAAPVPPIPLVPDSSSASSPASSLLSEVPELSAQVTEENASSVTESPLPETEAKSLISGSPAQVELALPNVEAPASSEENFTILPAKEAKVEELQKSDLQEDGVKAPDTEELLFLENAKEEAEKAYQKDEKAYEAQVNTSEQESLEAKMEESSLNEKALQRDNQVSEVLAVEAPKVESPASEAITNEVKNETPTLLDDESLNIDGKISYDDLEDLAKADALNSELPAVPAPKNEANKAQSSLEEGNLNKKAETLSFGNLENAQKTEVSKSEPSNVEVRASEVVNQADDKSTDEESVNNESQDEVPAPKVLTIEDRVAEVNEESKALAKENAEKVAQEAKEIEATQALEFGSYLE